MADDAGLRVWVEHRSDVNLGRDNVAVALYHPAMLHPIAVRETREVPVLFFQAGDARHLPYTFWQARHWAGNSPLILLGDKANRHYRGLEHVPIRDFASMVPRLRDLYVHISSNTAEFEFFCLARWLVMEEFARRQGLKEFLYLDSDVLLYETIGNIVRVIPPCRMTLAWEAPQNSVGEVVSAGEALIRDGGVLGEFCKTLISFYENRGAVDDAQKKFAEMVKNKKGGVSDMWFWTLFARQNYQAIHNTWDPEKEVHLDINIFQSGGFRYREGLKDIEFRDGQPYGFYEPTQRWVRFSTLHFGGASKKKMHQYLGRPSDLSLIYARLSERVQKGLGRHKPVLF
jgi:hypothetical protein